MLKKICTVQSQTNLETVDAIRKDENFLCCSIKFAKTRLILTLSTRGNDYLD